ncbi:lytic transglycosylase domain-containing protein [Sphingobacterium allocomposti]|jgi:membrane-bound lytic murein transglycosylase D|nr:lytic transglycosylase domain-containing protein [Sphingobacterium composti Yoo et al. 2007 non Ten et al. 2007]HLS94789.1 lytic transglycosylase domain-containing protein [Sphingobacterium sp.]
MLLSKLYSSAHSASKRDPIRTAMLAQVEKRKKAIALSPEKQKEAYYSSIRFADRRVPLQNPTVEVKFERYLANFSFRRQQSYDLHKKAAKHLPKIASILRSYGIPEDFKYIPLIESDMNPRVTSHRGAGGYWQFMPATARLYGLRVDGQVDERKDLIKSTHAAARYLKSLYKEFDDWTLVAAAYNVGGGNLKSTIRRQGTRDYYKLRLNKETGSYIYKLVSVKQVIENPNKHGYKRYAKMDDKYQHINEQNLL